MLVYLQTRENFLPNILLPLWFHPGFKTEEFNYTDKVMHNKSFLFVFKTSLEAELECFLFNVS